MEPEAANIASIDGVDLEYAWHGAAPDAAPTILLMHEGLGCVAMWRGFPAELARRTGCGVLVYSRRGYGGSAPVELPRPLSYMHDEAFNVLPHIIDHWGLRKVFLAGHSDGASIATIYAGGIQDHRIRGVILISPHFFNEDLCVKTITEARDTYENGTLRDKLQRHHGENVDCAFYGWNGAWLDPGFMDWNIEEFLPYIRVPVLLLWGKTDPYGTMAQVNAAERQLPCPIEVRIMPQSTHWPFREQPEDTMVEIEAFLSRLMDTHGETVAGSPDP